MTQNIIVQATKSLVIDLIGEILYFPIWWYTQGLKKMVLYVINSIQNTNRNLALTLMLKSMFKPMFGQYDREGRIISFFMRLILIIVRLIFFILLSILYLSIIIFWIFLPIVAVWGILSNFSSLWKA
ncbi:hypothetical protein KKH39_05335 [Patescibacteria group bacterium]|nr:hypothetical protein [Patescibacteria group bacterium]